MNRILIVVVCAVMAGLSFSCGSKDQPVFALDSPAPPPTLGLSADWTRAVENAEFSPRHSHSALACKDNMWVIGGRDNSVYMNDVWYSSTGSIWLRSTASASFSKRYGHSSVFHEEKMWVIGGNDGAVRNDVWNSSNGVDWTAVTTNAQFPARCNHTSLACNGMLWVLGGVDEDGVALADAWYSSDGVDWTQAVQSAQFLGRSQHSSAVYDGKMWVIAGWDGGYGYYNYDYQSDDGIVWSEAIYRPVEYAFTRYGHATVVRGDEMWVLGGYDPTVDQVLGDSWYTTDGATWRRAEDVGEFTGRRSHSALLYEGMIWILGGLDDAGVPLNDVWHMS